MQTNTANEAFTTDIIENKRKDYNIRTNEIMKTCNMNGYAKCIFLLTGTHLVSACALALVA